MWQVFYTVVFGTCLISEAHLTYAANCPLATAPCRKCKKIGHYAKLYRSAQSNTHEVHKIELPEVTILYMEYSALTSSITSTVTLSTSDSQTWIWWLALSGDYLSCPTALMYTISVTVCCRNP